MNAIPTPSEATTLARRVRLPLDDISHRAKDDLVIDIPQGWKIAKGKIQVGDRYLNCLNIPEITWCDIIELPQDMDDIYCDASHYACLIRKQKRVREVPK